MNSWSNPETIVALCGAFAALVTAIAAAWHTVNTRKVANNATTIASSASATAGAARMAVTILSNLNKLQHGDGPEPGHNQD